MITILSVEMFSTEFMDQGELCHLIMYSGVAGYAYAGLGFVDPKTGACTRPYVSSRFGLPPEVSGYGKDNACSHCNIKGVITAGGISSKYLGKEFFQTQYDGETPNGWVSPGLICWSDGDVSETWAGSLSIPPVSTWRDGTAAYYSWVPEFPILHQLGVTHSHKNWRGVKTYEVTFTGSTAGYSYCVRWDKSFIDIPDDTGSGTFAWNPTYRVYYMAEGSTGSMTMYALPVGNLYTPHYAQLDAKIAFSQLKTLMERMPDVPYEGRGPVRKAVEGFNAINMNNVENVGSLSVRDLLPLDALRSFRKNPVKGISNLYLWYKYSFAPNVSDLNEIWQNVDRLFADMKKEKKSYGTVVATSTYLNRSYSTCYSAYVVGSLNCRTELQTVAQRFSALGLGLNSQNVWDLIPFSFVVDWFVPISDILGEADYETSVMLNKWNISCVEQSTRTQWDCPAGVIFPGCTGSISLVRYNRSYDSRLPMNQFEFGSKNPIKHIFDGAALIVSNW